MNEVDGRPDTATAPAPGGTPASRLRAAREAQGLTLAEIAQRTRVPLAAPPVDRGERLCRRCRRRPTRSGSRARYARALGMDEVAIAQRGPRRAASTVVRPPEYEPYETPDPARVPSRGLAIVGLGVAIAILVLVGLWYGTDLFRGGATGGAVTTAEVPAAAPPITTTPARGDAGRRDPAAGDADRGRGRGVDARVRRQRRARSTSARWRPARGFDVPPTREPADDQRRAPRPVDRQGRRRRRCRRSATASARSRTWRSMPSRSRRGCRADRSRRRAPRRPRRRRAMTMRHAPAAAASSTPRPRPSARSALSETQRANLAAAANPPAASQHAPTRPERPRTA